MFYRLVVTANFANPPPTLYLKRIRDYILANAITINKWDINTEPSSYQLHTCFHDEDPNRPCALIDEYTTEPSP